MQIKLFTLPMPNDIFLLQQAVITFDDGAIGFEYILRETDAKHVEVIHSNDYVQGEWEENGSLLNKMIERISIFT